MANLNISAMPPPAELAELALIPMGDRHGERRIPDKRCWGRPYPQQYVVTWDDIAALDAKIAALQATIRNFKGRRHPVWLDLELEGVERQRSTMFYWYANG